MSTERPDSEGLVTALFTEYLGKLESGDTADLERLCSDAGEFEPELRRRVKIYESLRELSAVTPEPDTTGPKAIGNFELGRVIGSGGMGRVFLAEDRDLRRSVAIKVLEWERLFDQGERESILNEARSLAHLDHPGIVRVHEIGETDTFGYIVMEHVPGPSLDDVIRQIPAAVENSSDPEPENRLARETATALIPYSARVRCLLEIAEALIYCHDRGVIHRDIKPANVLFGKDGRPRLIDFGLAHLASEEGGSAANITQVLVGTPAYLAPEQVESEQTGADPLSDQFSFSVLAYNLLSGMNPFHLASRTATLNAIARATPPPLRSVIAAIGQDLERVVHHGLEREPTSRYQTMAHLAADLRAVLDQRPVSVHEPTMGQVARLWWRKYRRPARLAVGVVALLVLALSGMWVQQGRTLRVQIEERLISLTAQPAQSAQEYVDAGRSLEDLARTATTHDESRVRVALFGAIQPRVREQILAWSKHAREKLSAELANAERTNLSFQQPVAWSQVIEQERRLLPDHSDPDRFRDRGRISLLNISAESEITLYEQSPPEGANPARSGYFVFQNTAFIENPPPGFYRLEVWNPGEPSFWERDFLVLQEWDHFMDLELRAPHPVAFENASPVSRHEYSIETGMPGDYGKQQVPAFRISSRCVTRKEFLAFMNATGAAEPSTFDRGVKDSDAAWVDGHSAMEYAAWVGGRLPTLVEFQGAAERGAIDETTLNDWGHGEWISNLTPGAGVRNGSFVSYDRYIAYRAGSNPNYAALLTTIIPSPWDVGVEKTIEVDGQNGRKIGISFRVAFSIEPAQSSPKHHPADLDGG